MGLNQPYGQIEELPNVLPIFPLSGALLLPRGQMPLNIFEPRYLQMCDDALRGHRLLGMVQPNEAAPLIRNEPAVHAVGCAGRITQFAESGDGRLLITLAGVCRFRIREELTVTTPYRQCSVAFEEFACDLDANAGEADVDRDSVVRMLHAFAETNRVKLDWTEIEKAPNEALVNALAMMSPFGTVEKQALLEAETLKARAEVLVALAEMGFARGGGTSSVLQ
jgi:Lon protease-like protein